MKLTPNPGEQLVITRETSSGHDRIVVTIHRQGELTTARHLAGAGRVDIDKNYTASQACARAFEIALRKANEDGL